MNAKTSTKQIGRMLPRALGGTRTLARASYRAGRAAGRIEGRRSARPRRRRPLLLAAAFAAGAATAYLADPERGERRRHALRDAAFAHRDGAKRDSSELNDPGLEAKVESELFKPDDAPKGSVNVNVENGVVFLRGEVPSREQSEDLAKRAELIDGVERAENLLRVAG